MHVAAARPNTGVVSPTQTEQISERQRALDDRTSRSDVASDSAADTRRDVLRATAAPRPEDSTRFTLTWLPFTLTSLSGATVAIGILIIGLFIAQAALLPVVAGCSRPSEAWAIVARRFRPLLHTTLLAVILITVGLACFALPGVVLALGFSVAAPVVLTEGIGGPGALQRSWDLMRRAWRPQLGIILLGSAAVIAIRWVVARYLPVHGLASRVLLNALVSTLVLPFPIAASAMLYLAARRALDGADTEEVCQSIRMLSNLRTSRTGPMNASSHAARAS
jgi:hypothetical protein